MTHVDSTLNAPISPKPSKPHRGKIKDWRIINWYGRKVVIGEFVDHWEFGGKRGCTSEIVKRNGSEIETRNSRYTLVGDEDSEKDE